MSTEPDAAVDARANQNAVPPVATDGPRPKSPDAPQPSTENPASAPDGGPKVDGTEQEKPQPNGNRQEIEELGAKGPRPTKTSDLREKFADKKHQLTNKTKPAGGYDPIPLPDAPQGYTVKFIFHRATNLPVADMHTHAADPFLQATLTADVPKRHNEDPLLIHRTPTIRKTTEPEWENEWIVANVPASGFTLKCRLYDEDWPDHDDRLGNVTIRVPHVDENWEGIGAAGPDGEVFEVKKRSGSKRAYFLRAVAKVINKNVSMTPLLYISMEVLGKSDPPHAQMYTVGPTTFVKHFSPMIGRLTGIKVNKDEEEDATSSTHAQDNQLKKYDFQANEIQLSGPVPPKLYHRYVEFRPIIRLMFASRGITGHILNKVLHKQHKRIYNYDSSTEYGSFEACSEQASLQFLKMAHFDEGGRVFTYVLTLDGLMRFTETGREFGIDLLSKHTMHSDVATYIACSGEFFIRRLAHADAAEDLEPREPTHPSQELPGGPPHSPPPRDPRHYQLIIDNDSGTYRPDKSTLPELKVFLERNFPGLGIVVMHWENEELQKLKKAQHEVKKKEGPRVKMVLNRSPTGSSFSSDDESRLGDLVQSPDEDPPLRSKKERMFDVLQDPMSLREYIPHGAVGGGGGGGGGETSDKGKSKDLTAGGMDGGQKAVTA
ncbi:hypothetical protein B0H66DRAFT_473069 [Apodospora peruviana]|uniref:C2 domain-containing protein n=1 Tax=Apodospora peruviana TaxID=516989 RepID=A0AAE0IC35_9PEZI|nr:hypothetical protein B0H66DRAFT_473069 [Apodospora peruviana]